MKLLEKILCKLMFFAFEPQFHTPGVHFVSLKADDRVNKQCGSNVIYLNQLSVVKAVEVSR